MFNRVIQTVGNEWEKRVSAVDTVTLAHERNSDEVIPETLNPSCWIFFSREKKNVPPFCTTRFGAAAPEVDNWRWPIFVASRTVRVLARSTKRCSTATSRGLHVKAVVSTKHALRLTEPLNDESFDALAPAMSHVSR